MEEVLYGYEGQWRVFIHMVSQAFHLSSFNPKMLFITLLKCMVIDMVPIPYWIIGIFYIFFWNDQWSAKKSWTWTGYISYSTGSAVTTTHETLGGSQSSSRALGYLAYSACQSAQKFTILCSRVRRRMRMTRSSVRDNFMTHPSVNLYTPAAAAAMRWMYSVHYQLTYWHRWLLHPRWLIHPIPIDDG